MDLKLVQRQLNKLGFGPISEDGKTGPLTVAAIKAFQKSRGLPVDGLAGPKTLTLLFPVKRLKLLSTGEIIAKYGQPGTDNLVIMQLPYPMRIAWDLQYFANKIQCHKLVAEPLKAVFQEILSVYGIDEIKRLDLDLYGGCYNFRKMRGGNDWSRHSWGIAIDLSPEKNGLKATDKTAQFAKPEYKKMIEIFYKHGFVGLGPEKNYDWMHFEIGV